MTNRSKRVIIALKSGKRGASQFLNNHPCITKKIGQNSKALLWWYGKSNTVGGNPAVGDWRSSHSGRR